MNDEFDTIVVPAHQEWFEQLFWDNDCWFAVRIDKKHIDKLKFIAVHQGKPIAAITHIRRSLSTGHPAPSGMPSARAQICWHTRARSMSWSRHGMLWTIMGDASDEKPRCVYGAGLLGAGLDWFWRKR
ncbi:hypothetical protein [Verminephrobacter eiseniae]|uniref:hypothetical protein n=1 Tax=Verminephrobacter eiseniae TaxID=364317 RepID=UPI0022373E8F|nr:hypothetical protein [Verminephrobacter eiseniae]MCW5234484.1 hypothetical protein [Verminephrobacter eiseniae]MCW5293939.1 hypothetical protein [Verminephrobacter eiseniae]MCW8186034.1 hypothetical protein [Verminephrobacter eiseniae]MCW8222231.1 hypothetical protein [Verminephrobacter eiseniae]MCW8235285.1 hypothetical protein [Verminephrobacter eiseniae]